MASRASTIDGAGGANGRILGDVGEYPSAVATTAGLFVFYYDEGNSALRYGRFDGSSWTGFGVVDGGFSNSGANGQLTGYVDTLGASPVQHQGVPHVYYTLVNGYTGPALLRGAYWNGSSFSAMTLDLGPSGNACGTSSISTDIGVNAVKAVRMSDDNPRVYYAGPGETLRMAQYSP